MADRKTKKDQKPPFDYGAEKKKLLSQGPQRVYILRGEEDFLRDSFLRELRALCVEEGTEAFNYHRMEGGLPDMNELREAINAMPFMGERTMVEVRDFDVNKVSAYDSDALREMLADVPDWVTVAFVFAPNYAPDNRLGVVKAMKKTAVDIEFRSPAENVLRQWIVREVRGNGRTISAGTAEYLVFICGERMNVLRPEIIKICGAAAGEEITRADIDAVARKSPETTIFQLTDALGAKKYDQAAQMLGDLLADRDEPPQKQIYMVSEQFRRLYVAKIAQECGKPESFISDCIPELAGKTWFIRRIRDTARNFSRARLARAVRLCAECDFGMKSSGGPEPAEQMKELLLRLAMDHTG